MSTTRTGSYPIGFRRGWSDWQKRSVKGLAEWAKESGFEVLDLMNVTAEDLGALREAGLRIGSADLLDFGKIMSNDPGQRKELVQKNVDYVKRLTPLGAKAFFTCIIPGDPSKPRSENHALAVECFTPIAEACAAAGASLAIEGWPGGGPHYANLCCNPETTRAFIRDVGRGVGLNYDPSHLIRLGIDHVRFVREFAPFIRHVHAKDTELDAEALYEFGTQGAAFTKPHGFGEWTWRYTLPGRGVTRWREVFHVLSIANYAGAVCIELEDENFNGSEDGEKTALTQSLEFLQSV